jgi:hypothetical protein
MKRSSGAVGRHRGLLVVSGALNAVLFGAALVLARRLGWQTIVVRLRQRRSGPDFYGTLGDTMFGAQVIPDGGVALIGDSQIQFAPLLEMLTPYRVRGIGGSLVANLLAWLDPVLDQAVSRIVIMTGTNDARRAVPLAETVAAFGQILDRIADRRPECVVALVSVPPMPKFRPAVAAINDALRELAAARGCLWVDLTPELEGTPWSRDGVHLTPDAYRRIAPLIAAASGAAS